MWIYVWDNAIKCIYLWDTPLKEVYLWDTKIRPIITEKIIEFLLVWWGWAWWQARAYSSWWWGGWAWGVVHCTNEVINNWTYPVTIWLWWCWACHTCVRCGGNSTFNWYTAYGGWRWAYWCASCTSGDFSRNWGNGASWWWSARCWSAWTWTQWCDWGSAQSTLNAWWWWGGWFTSCWCISNSTWSSLCYCRNWWDWWAGYSSDISWEIQYYAYWGWGWAWNSRWAGWVWYCWWWSWGNWTVWCMQNSYWCPATSCWSWGWWAWWFCCNCASRTISWDGGNGVFILRYPSNCWYNITWWTKYLCNWYCIHCFTSDWTLTVN